MNALLQKLQLLYAAGTQVTPENARETAHYLYEALTVLDRKAAALLAFDGILVAALSFTIEKESVFGARWHRVLTLLVIIVVLVAAALCLLAAQISYPFLDKVGMTPGHLDFSAELSALSGELVSRTVFYRAAWWLSLLALPMFMTMFVTSLQRKNDA